MLGLDPLYVANEGKLIAVVPAERRRRLVDAMRAHPLGRDAAVDRRSRGRAPGHGHPAVARRRRAVRHAARRESNCRGSADDDRRPMPGIADCTAGGRSRTRGESRVEPHSRKGAARMAESNGVPYGRKTQREPAVKEVHVLWITAGLSCDGDSVSVTAATPAQHRGHRHGGHPRAAQGPPAQPGARLRERRRVHEVLVPGRRGPARRPVRPGHRGLDPQREDQERGLLGGAGHRQEDRPADHHLRVDRPPGAQGLGRGRGRHLRDLRRHPRDGRQPDRRHGPGRLPRLELAVEGRRADRQRAGLPGPAGQHDRDAALPALPGRRAWRR